MTRRSCALALGVLAMVSLAVVPHSWAASTCSRCSCPCAQNEHSCMPSSMTSTTMDPSILSALNLLASPMEGVHSSLKDASCKGTLRFKKGAQLTVCFAHEDTKHHDEMGYFTMDDDNNMSDHVLFPDVSMASRGKGGCMQPGNCVTVNVAANTRLGFYLGVGAYEKGRADRMLRSTDNERSMVVAFDDDTGALMLAMDEGDEPAARRDFNDVLFYATVSWEDEDGSGSGSGSGSDSGSDSSHGMGRRLLAHEDDMMYNGDDDMMDNGDDNMMDNGDDNMMDSMTGNGDDDMDDHDGPREDDKDDEDMKHPPASTALHLRAKLGEVLDLEIVCHVRRGVRQDPEQEDDDFCPREDAPTPTRPVQVNGREYALLDNTDFYSVMMGCQRGLLKVPHGWQIAPVHPETFAALASFPWASECVVLDDGFAYRPATGKRCFSMEPCLESLQVDCLGTLRCARVLLVNSVDVYDHIVIDNSFRDPDSVRDQQWFLYGLPGFEVVNETACGAGQSFKVPGPSEEGDRGEPVGFGSNENEFGNGVWRDINDTRLLEGGLLVSLWSRSEDVQPKPNPDREPRYAMWLDVWFMDGDGRGDPDDSVLTEFSFGTHGWEYRQIKYTAPPGRQIRFVRLYLFLREVTGTAWFSCLEFGTAVGSVIQNGNFAERERHDSSLLKHWHSLRDTRTYVARDEQGPRDHSMGAMCCNGISTSGPSNVCGGQQIVSYSEAQHSAQNWTDVLVAGCAKASGVEWVPPEGADLEAGADPADFSLYLDVEYADGSFDYGRAVPFEFGSYNWTCVAEIFPLRAPVSRFLLSPIVRNRRVDDVCFDAIYLVPFNRFVKCDGAGFGDPHFVTFDRQFYDLQEPGEYLLADDGELSVQGRFEMAGPIASVITATATGFHGSNFFVERAEPGVNAHPTTRINGGLIRLRPGDTVPLVGEGGMTGQLTVEGSLGSHSAPLTYRLTFPTGHRVDVTVHVSAYTVQYMDVHVVSPAADKPAISGLLNGMFGTELAGSRSLRRLSGADLDSVRVSDGNSVMHYRDTPRGEQFFTQSVAPGKLNDHYDNSAIRSARRHCRSVLTNPALVEACVVDVVTMGDPGVAFSLRSIEASLATGRRSRLQDDDDNHWDDDDDHHDEDGAATLAVPAAASVAAWAVAAALRRRV